ncbi:MAG: hypothetical protein J6M05_05920 [Cardiobacteriaceae bacterium]|nr:hypothetical protein [Cardiobacteriaceae bacterium]
MNKIFVKNNREQIQNSVITNLNSVVIINTNASPRTVGDAVQEYLEDKFVDCLPKDIVKEFSTSFARRAMADFAFTDIDGKYYVVDCKTHNLATAFNMPNLTSVERLARFYEDFNNYFAVLIIAYKFEDTKLLWTDCKFVPIELLDWSCLTIGALGWGQIQIANSNNIVINENNTRKKWMLELCARLEQFYPNEIAKITKRIEHFKKIKEFWEEQAD